MPENVYQLGDLIRSEVQFFDDNGDPMDPQTINFSIRKPNGQLITFVFGTDPEIVKDAPGVYHCDADIDVTGRWFHRWFSTGTGQTADERSFTIQPSVAS